MPELAVYDGFMPFKKELIREIVDADVDRLLQVRIRRISLFDINKHREEMEQTKADLAPGAITLVTARAKSGEPLTLKVPVSNLGQASASGIVVRFLVDGVAFGADKTLAQLAGGSSSTVSSDTGTTPKKDGTHTAQVIVDPANTVAESNEANNTASLTFRAKGGKVVR